jgi:hypothetical protein
VCKWILGHERARGRQDDHQLKSSPNEIFGTTPVQRNNIPKWSHTLLSVTERLHRHCDRSRCHRYRSRPLSLRSRGPIVVVSLFSGAWSRPLTHRTSSTWSGANTLSWSQLFAVTPGALGRDQFHPDVGGHRRGAVAVRRIVRQAPGPVLVTGAQDRQRLGRNPAVGDELLQAFMPHTQGLRPGGKLGRVLALPFAGGVFVKAEPAYQTRQQQPLPDQRDNDDTESEASAAFGSSPSLVKRVQCFANFLQSRKCSALECPLSAKQISHTSSYASALPLHEGFSLI